MRYKEIMQLKPQQRIEYLLLQNNIEIEDNGFMILRYGWALSFLIFAVMFCVLGDYYMTKIVLIIALIVYSGIFLISNVIYLIRTNKLNKKYFKIIPYGG